MVLNFCVRQSFLVRLVYSVHSEGGSIAFMLGAKGKVDFVISMAGIGVKGDTALTAQTNKILELTGQSMRFSTHQYRMNTIIKRSPWLNFLY